MLNIRKFTQNRERTEKVFNFAADGRLSGLVTDKVTVHLDLEGDMDEKARAHLIGSAEAEMKAICQVCMQEIQWQHHFSFTVYPVTEEELETLDEALEPVVYEQDKLDLDDMLINELILSLPTVISHESTIGEDCSQNLNMSAGEPIKKKASPFDVLKQLKS